EGSEPGGVGETRASPEPAAGSGSSAGADLRFSHRNPLSGQNVPSAHFTLHEARCLRLRTTCPECREVVLREQLEDHQAHGHKQVQCSLCLQSMQKYLLEAHQAQCPERPIECEFCELAVPLSHLEEHESSCGGHTVPSLDHILPAQLAGHEDGCMYEPEEARKAPRKKVCCSECGRDVPEEKLSQHQEKCGRLTDLMKSFDACSVKRAAGPRPGAAPASAAQRVVRPKKKKGHQLPPASSPLGREVPLCSGSSRAARSRDPWAEQEEEEEYNVLEACSHCSILLPRPLQRQHKEKCRSFLSHPNGPLLK
ncbi:XIAP-associated factor 1, partial [Gracilinanus agilis]|uniref:XIAP-associated factor 1 n=1 Tax=Gracilinanus agilis TaxID=191870 RepID=UPI001CFEFBEE